MTNSFATATLILYGNGATDGWKVYTLTVSLDLLDTITEALSEHSWNVIY